MSPDSGSGIGFWNVAFVKFSSDYGQSINVLLQWLSHCQDYMGKSFVWTHQEPQTYASYFKDGNIATLADYGIILHVYRSMIILVGVIDGPIALINYYKILSEN